MRNKIAALVSKANSTEHEAEKASCLRLAEKLCTKHGYDFYELSGIKCEASSSTRNKFRDGFRNSCNRPDPESWDFGEAYEETKKARTLKDLYTFKNSFYYSKNGNLTFFEDDIRITFMEDDYGFTVCVDGVWYNDIDELHECYTIAYEAYRNKTK
jgi:hypothetical protein